MEETVELLAPRAQAKHIEIASFVEDDVPRHLLGDAARLRQVLLNLAGNAIKFTESGGVSILVERGSGADDIRFLVCDTGIGIAPEAQERIFLEFEQADAGAARKFSGTGLGLAISRRIVDAMGGRIGVYSTPGAGSTFFVTVPLARAAEAPDAAFAPPGLAGQDVLIVAPSPIESTLVARRLMRWGARVVRRAERRSRRAAARRTGVERHPGRPHAGHRDLRRTRARRARRSRGASC